MNKGLIKNIIPDYRFEKITDIQSDIFKSAKLIIMDLDNTLVFSETTTTNQEIIDWFFPIKNQYECIIVSNSKTKFKRRKEVIQLFACDIFLSKHRKPFKKLFQEIQQRYHVDGSQVFVVGDRIFTDVLFGNLNEATTILVKPLSGRENVFIKVLRALENALLLFINNLGYSK